MSSTRSDQDRIRLCSRAHSQTRLCRKILHTTSPDGDVKMTVCTDSDAARGMIHRVGCGRVRHLQTRYLWHQQALREGQLNVVRCGTDRESERSWHEGSGKRGDGELYEQACNRPCEHFANCDRCNPGTSDQCERRNDCGRVLFETSGKHDNWSGEHG